VRVVELLHARAFHFTQFSSKGCFEHRWTLFILFIGFHQSLNGEGSLGAASELSGDPEMGDCGPASLYVAARHLGVIASYGDIRKVTLGGRGYSSFRTLRRCANGLGLRTHLARMAPEDLSDQSLPAILLVRGNHFVTCLDHHEGRFLIVDSPVCRRVSRSELERVWDGQTLVISRGSGARPSYWAWDQVSMTVLGSLACASAAIWAATSLLLWRRRKGGVTTVTS